MNLFLDYSRLPKEVYTNMHSRIGKEASRYLDLEWSVVSSFREFVNHIEKNGMPSIISFGHDLAEEHYEILCACGSSDDFPEQFTEKTGLDCAKWLVGYHLKSKSTFPKTMVHSMNPYGSEKIKQYISDYRKQFLNS